MTNIMIITDGQLYSQLIYPHTFLLLYFQGARLEDQRSTLPEEHGAGVADEEQEAGGPVPHSRGGTTVPDEDFFSLIMRLQSSGRMEDQRASVPTDKSKIARKDKKK